MMKTKSSLLVIALALLIMPCAGFAQAGYSGHAKMGHPSKGGMHWKGHKKGKMGGHIFGSNWKETLTGEQKATIDKQHLELKKKLAPLKAQLSLKKVELNNMILTDGISLDAIKVKIREILAAKEALMELKYFHKVEMRRVLTVEQRVSFDLGLIAKSVDMGH